MGQGNCYACIADIDVTIYVEAVNGVAVHGFAAHGSKIPAGQAELLLTLGHKSDILIRNLTVSTFSDRPITY